MTTTEVDNHNAKYDSLLKGDYVKSIANGLDFFVGAPPADLDRSRKSFFEIIDVRAGDVTMISRWWSGQKEASRPRKLPWRSPSSTRTTIFFSAVWRRSATLEASSAL